MREKMELTELCKEINNWFDVKRNFGVFTIKNGSLKNVEELGLLENQYFRIVGSISMMGFISLGRMILLLTKPLMVPCGQWLCLLRSLPCLMK